MSTRLGSVSRQEDMTRFVTGQVNLTNQISLNSKCSHISKCQRNKILFGKAFSFNINLPIRGIHYTSYELCRSVKPKCNYTAVSKAILPFEVRIKDALFRQKFQKGTFNTRTVGQFSFTTLKQKVTVIQ